MVRILRETQSAETVPSAAGSTLRRKMRRMSSGTEEIRIDEQQMPSEVFGKVSAVLNGASMRKPIYADCWTVGRKEDPMGLEGMRHRAIDDAVMEGWILKALPM